MPTFWPKSNKSQHSHGTLGQYGSHFEGSPTTNREYPKPDEGQRRYNLGVPAQGQTVGYATSPQPDRRIVDHIQQDRVRDQETPRRDRYPSSYAEDRPQIQEPRKGLRNKLGIGSLRDSAPQAHLESQQQLNIGRSVSLRRKESPGSRQSPSPAEPPVPSLGDWSLRRASAQLSIVSKEEAHDRHGDYSRNEEDVPPVPPKHSQLAPGLSSQYHQQGAHSIPRLQRSGTDSNLLAPGRRREDTYHPTGVETVSRQVPSYSYGQPPASQQTIRQKPPTLHASRTGSPQPVQIRPPLSPGSIEPSSTQYQQEPQTIRPPSQQSQSSLASEYQQYQAYSAAAQTQIRQDSGDSSRHPALQLTAGASNPLSLQRNRKPMDGSKNDSTPGVTAPKSSAIPSAAQSQHGEQERGTPNSVRGSSDATNSDLERLLAEHTMLREKYNNVKLKYFERARHVEHLQNMLANQRLSQSNTSLDDSGYVTKFNQLDGLVGQLAFSVKKEWKAIPPWLQTVVNKDATTLGSREMIGVGKAVICRWILDDIFNKYFHPGLEPALSSQLKLIQNNLRTFTPLPQSNEEHEGLDGKIIAWRLATLEGLQDVLRSEQASVNQHSLSAFLNEKLVALLQVYLKDPLPVGIENGTMMIIQRAIDIAQHLPQESREVRIDYYLPGHSIVNEYMKLEGGIASLASTVDGSEVDRVSVKSTASESRDSDMRDTEQNSPSVQEPKRKGLFGGLINGKRGAGSAQSQAQQKQLGSVTASSQTSLASKEDGVQRVRFSTGFAVSIRNRMVLVKASVYAT